VSAAGFLIYESPARSFPPSIPGPDLPVLHIFPLLGGWMKKKTGGPGGGVDEKDRRTFDPDVYKIVSLSGYLPIEGFSLLL